MTASHESGDSTSPARPGELDGGAAPGLSLATEAGAQLAPSYAVKLPTFEGPLDLLLHLIRQNEVEITEIPIGRIADQYLETLSLMDDLNLEVAAEYLVMAATLAWIKSRMLLPPSGLEGEEEGIDPREELVARLLEYQRFKEVAEQLGERPLLDRDVYRAWPQALEPTPEEEREIEVSVVALVSAFQQVLRRVPEGDGIHQVASEPVSVHERMVAVMNRLRERDSFEFEQLMLEDGALPSRAAIIATFLGLLELVRIGAVRVFQSLGDDGVPRGPIRLRRNDDSGESWESKISEQM